MKRKILSVVIALAMMLTLLPTVFATVEDVGTGSVHISVANGTGGDEGKVLLTITTTDAFTADDNIYYAVFTDLAWTNSGTWAGFEQDNTVLGEKKMELGKVSHTYTEDITAMVQGQTGILHILCYDDTGGSGSSERVKEEFVNGLIKTPFSLANKAAGISLTAKVGEKMTDANIVTKAGATGGMTPYKATTTETDLFGLALTNNVLGGTATKKGALTFTATVADSAAPAASDTIQVTVTIAEGTQTLKAPAGVQNMGNTAPQDFTVTSNASGDTGFSMTATSSDTSKATVSVAGTKVTVTPKADAEGEVTITVNSGATTNYGAATAVTFKVNLQGKTPATLTGPDSLTMTYGESGKTVKHTVNSPATVAYAVATGGDVVEVDANGVLKAKKAGTATITVSAPAAGEFGAANNKTVTVTVEKADITGIPAFTAVTAAGKTLNDVLDPASCTELTGVDPEKATGTFTWTKAATEEVVQGTEYEWTFTPSGDSDDKYNAKTGTVTPWPKAGGSGIVIGGSKQTYTVTYNVGSHGNFSSDASTTEKVAKNETPKNVPVVHPHDNYRFMGWTLDGKTVVDPTTQKITKNVTFTALYEACDHMAYMVGRSDTQFAPNGNLTRAEAATILSRLTAGFDENGTYAAAPYSDLNTAAWYAKYVNFAASKGIVNGRPDGTFDPDASITRAEFATMIANFAGVGRVEAPSASNDVAGHWAAGYIVALERANIVTGYEDGTFRPNANITRAEAATMVNGAIDRTPDTALDLAANSYTNPFTDVTAGQWFFAQVMEATVNHVTAHFHTDK